MTHPERPTTAPRSNSGRGWQIAAVVALLLTGAGAWWLLAGPGAEPEGAGPPVDTVAAPAPEPADTASGAPEPGADLPPVEASDSTVRRLADDVSEREAWERWLSVDGLARRFSAAVVSVAAGSSPREHLDFLAPEGEFSVRETGGRTVIAPASYDRYDAVAATLASVDPAAVARIYERLHPLFVEAYERLGLAEEQTFDEAVADAVGRLLAVQGPEGPVEVVADGGVWVYRDPDLEALSPAAKHLLRMGPENARRIQQTLRALVEATDIPAPEPPRP